MRVEEEKVLLNSKYYWASNCPNSQIESLKVKN